jgi:predicted ATP-grasp superfamily ATP-dependent carboligase
MDRSIPVLIAAASGRALAASARRGGYAPLVADAFGDQDTLAVVSGHAQVDLLNRPVDDEKLIAALEVLARGHDPIGIVCGSGFEDRADLLTRLAARWRLLGNAPEIVARLKDPLAFATICRAAGIPHPETSLAPPPEPSGWLVKRAGGAGGQHIRPAGSGHAAPAGAYYQRHVEGVPVSALLLANGRDVMVLGFSAQWSSPTSRRPFRYGGAVRPAPLAEDLRQALTAAIERLVAEIPLVGLNSADFLIDREDFHLLEVNPRPGATFDLFELRTNSLFALHVDACAGRLPAQVPAFDSGRAGAILYARRDIAAIPPLDWPEWVADRPVAGSRVNAGGPLCSVFAEAATAAQARALVEERSAQLHAELDARLS